MTIQKARDLIRKDMVVLVDTREKTDAKGYAERVKTLGFPSKRVCLPVGDYTAACSLSDGITFDLTMKVVVERKSSIDELAGNLCSSRDRKRFFAELVKAKEAAVKVYLLIEATGGWNDILKHKYRSQFKPELLIAALCQLQAAYGVHIVFCSPDISGRMISEILQQEMKVALLCAAEEGV